jgi:hypothetical protein
MPPFMQEQIMNFWRQASAQKIAGRLRKGKS